MTQMKWTIAAIAAGLLCVLYWTPGAWIVQLGLRKIAFEQGVKAAQQHWSFEAAPTETLVAAEQETKRKGRR